MKKKKNKKEEEIHLEMEPSLETAVYKFSNHVVLGLEDGAILLDFLSVNSNQMVMEDDKIIVRAPVASRIALSPLAALRMAKEIEKKISGYLTKQEIIKIIKDMD